MVDALAILYIVECIVCQYIEIAACEHLSRQNSETNQHTYLCPKIGLWKSQLVAQLVVRPFN